MSPDIAVSGLIDMLYFMFKGYSGGTHFLSFVLYTHLVVRIQLYLQQLDAVVFGYVR